MVVVAVAASAMVVRSDGGSTDQGRAGATFVSPEGSTEIGSMAPDFALPALFGNGVVRLSDFRGRPVVVNFWASWCNPCREEFALLERARDRHADQGLEVIGVSYRDIASDGRAFASSRDTEWPLVRDPGGRLASRYGVRAIPQTFFVRPDGTIAARVFGITSAADLRRELDAILTPPSGSTEPRAAALRRPTAPAR